MMNILPQNWRASLYKHHFARTEQKGDIGQLLRQFFRNMNEGELSLLAKECRLCIPKGLNAPLSPPDIFFSTEDRFGNFYLGLKKATIFSLCHHIKKIFISPLNNMFRLPSGDSLFRPVDFLRLRKSIMLVPHRHNFFFHLDTNRYRHSTPTAERDAIALIRPMLLCPPRKIAASTLVIHIRSGDIFRKPHRLYHQPPLAWYTLCIRDFQKKYREPNVVIVHEDWQNPCVNALKQWCEERDIPVKMQSGTLREDYSYIMSAHALVESFGTFSLPARDLSVKLKRIYTYKDDYADPAAYIRRGEWTAAPAQVKRMLTLREEELCLPENLAEVSGRYHPANSAEVLKWLKAS